MDPNTEIIFHPQPRFIWTQHWLTTRIMAFWEWRDARIEHLAKEKIAGIKGRFGFLVTGVANNILPIHRLTHKTTHIHAIHSSIFRRCFRRSQESNWNHINPPAFLYICRCYTHMQRVLFSLLQPHLNFLIVPADAQTYLHTYTHSSCPVYSKKKTTDHKMLHYFFCS